MLRRSLCSIFVTSYISIGLSTFSTCVNPNMASIPKNPNLVRLFLVGDVMLGRGVDQILQHSNDPVLYEGYVKDAREYVKLALTKNGPLPSNRSVNYVWGDAIQILDRFKPDVRVINLETSVTTNSEPWPGKGIHYRMHPKNVEVLEEAKLDCIVLANNHVLDWHYAGLNETLKSLQNANFKTVGAGRNIEEAEKPAIFDLGDNKRVLIYAFGHVSAGVPQSWKATPLLPGVNYIEISSASDTNSLANKIKSMKQERDVVVVSIHWGSNWDFDLEPGQKKFAHKLIDEGAADLIYGHSSHHIKGVELYKNKLIIYGCGDFLSDYEGINNLQVMSAGFRDDVSFMYFPDLDATTGKLVNLYLVPMRLKKMQVKQATEKDDLEYLFGTMKRECKNFGLDLEKDEDGNYFKLKF